MDMIDSFLDRLGHLLGRWLAQPREAPKPAPLPAYALVMRHLQPGDVLLVEGRPSKISAAIKYLTQSSWSHAALFVGDALGKVAEDGMPLVLVEAEVGVGVIASPLSKFAASNVRICRPVGLSPEDRETVVRYAIHRIGDKYDMRNIIDLLRYFLPHPPVPSRWRRRVIALGSGDPTRAICSTLIASAFEAVRYPVLPTIEYQGAPEARREVLHVRHHSLYAPRDFDVSPYFAIVKPTIEEGFDYKAFSWAEPEGAPAADPA